ncbi:hypothetical protein [Acinetobacter haemolyticus]|uniref:hypothetical protein n=1 Tax=Acinetobacter haemolyticus TaxID=29430 RepID=UPI000E57D8C7|nr:hypothetical protein [Acinetobacter haemolyticus]QDJ92684.1 hypothetical protein AhaeAN54_011675 [Acinetobacter haemolyticus]
MKKIVLLGLVLVLMGCDSKEVKEYNAAVKERESHEKMMAMYVDNLHRGNQYCINGKKQDEYYHSLNPNEPLITISTLKTCEDVDVFKKFLDEEKDKHGKLLEKESILKQKAGL